MSCGAVDSVLKTMSDRVSKPRQPSDNIDKRARLRTNRMNEFLLLNLAMLPFSAMFRPESVPWRGLGCFGFDFGLGLG